MKSLATYIEYLLMTRHYAFVPGLGGFRIREVAARVSRSMDARGVTQWELVPPHQEVVFNRFVEHDDGLLLDTYMEFEQLTCDEAAARIRMEVGQWKAALERRETVTLGAWGTLSADEDCHTLFTPATDGTGLISGARHYGLETLHLEGLAPAEAITKAPVTPTLRREAEATESEERITLHLNRYRLQRVAMVVLILACCFVGFFLPSRHSTDSTLAGVVDSEILTGLRQPNVVLRHSWEEVWDEEVARLAAEQGDSAVTATDMAEAVVAETEITEDMEAVTPAEPAPIANTSTPTAEKLYYIIVGSCADSAEADRQMARLHGAGIDDAGVILKDGRYRICLRAYDDRATAESCLEEVRTVERFHDAWLLPARQATVTYISKIKYNEQLPMELSHLTTGTKRDQGGNHS